MSKVTVLGSGQWGSTMAQVLSDAGNHVLMWGRNQGVVDEINTSHTNTKYLDKNVLPAGLRATSDIKEAFDYSSIYVLAIPAQSLRENLNLWRPLAAQNALYISTLKGIELSTQQRMSQIIEDVMATRNVAIITGPNLAYELILRHPAGAVVAAHTTIVAEKVVKLFATPYYRVYTSTDILGCEFAGAIKSIIALAVGMSIGMGYGENTQAMVITRGLNEVARLTAAHGADPLSAAGLAGMGDLVASCGSPLSRNRTFGEVLGRSGSMAVAREQVAKTVEGVASSSAVVQIARSVGIEVPVIEAVADVCAGTLSPMQAFDRLMEITTRSENFIK
ncbi:MAG: NAD(P)-dependent glycerol-3-phosphate dehydrogenase [Candidatus Planktophila sp.]|jgi:glycerol-3-phosphate dehydrogenase (NAD(P)+)|nr:NAD(P)-dependent glycerol-3-phosphate dehydrogenase [Candidatus Planktophila sp.]